MSQVSNISRTATGPGVANLTQDNYADGIVRWYHQPSPISGIFDELGTGNYTLTGKKLIIAADDNPSLNFMGTDGWLPDAAEQDVVRIETVAKRMYDRRAMDNFTNALTQANAFENQYERLQRQLLDSVQRKTTMHVIGSEAAIVCEFVSRTSATTIVVANGYGHPGTSAFLFTEPGARYALLDADNSHAVIGAAELTSVQPNVPVPGQATLTFASAIDQSSTATTGDPIVFASSTSTGAANFVTEFGNAPIGLMDIMDPDGLTSVFMGLNEASSPRWSPKSDTSQDFGHVEIMGLANQVKARSGQDVDDISHVLLMQPGVEQELAKELLSFQQQNQLGGMMHGGWRAPIRIGDWSCISDPNMLHDVVQLLCLDDLFVVPLNNEMLGYIDEDGSQFNRIADYDGVEWAMRSYLQRFTNRRNRHGQLLGVPNPDHYKYAGGQQ